MESFGQCIYAWMHAENETVGRLAERLGYKSKTSLFRLLHGKSNYRSCVRFYDRILPDLDEYWKSRFHRALRAEKIGMNRCILLDSIYRCLLCGDDPKPGTPPGIHTAPFAGGTVTVLGCSRSGTFGVIDELLAMADPPRVIHYVTRYDLFNSPELLPGFISHITSLSYSALLLDEADLYGAGVPWNIALWAGKDDAYIMLENGNGEHSWSRLSGGAAQAQSIISTLNAVPHTSLYRCDRLLTSKDYIDFTEQSYRMEYNCKTLIIKTTPGMQMLPADIVKQSFMDFLAKNLEPVSAARDTLIYIFEKRVKNFFSRTKPTYLVLSLESMLRFARDGLLDDQFFACRPFTKAERVQIIHALRTFSQKENVYVSFLDQKSWMISAEVYDGRGALFYPDSTDYNTSNGVYRELFLPGKEYSDLFFQFAEEYVFSENHSLKNSDDLYNTLLRAAT